MIVIKTANGDRFINESEAQSVTHNKKCGYVAIKFKDGHSENAFQVERMYYTNKQDVEIRDDGLLMAAVASDAEYYKELNVSACAYLKRLANHRSRLENMIVEMYEHPDSDKEYRERFVKEIHENWNNRPGTIERELDDYRTEAYYRKLREDSHEKGEEIEKEFVRMSAKIKELEEWKERYRKAQERLMLRNLWQRIFNKMTYL